LAVSAMQAAEFIGMPEARITLAQATTYLAAAPKSNAAYKAICSAMEDIENGRIQDVPDYLQSGKKIVPATQAYKYAHDGDGHFVDQSYMKKPITYYYPTEEGFEKRIKQRLDELEKRRDAST
jgi:putative ATPase